MECPFCGREERCNHMVYVAREHIPEDWDGDFKCEHEVFADLPNSKEVRDLLHNLAKWEDPCDGYHYKSIGLMEEEMEDVETFDEDGDLVFEEAVTIRSWYAYVSAPAEFCDWVRQAVEGKSVA